MVDVPYSLSRYFPSQVYHRDFIESIESTIRSIVLPNWTCNDIDYTTFDFSRFTAVESIEIKNNSFGSVNMFIIDGLHNLITLKIGLNSFTKTKNSFGRNKDRSFHILNCDKLQSIDIGEFSFSDFGGEFELNNLPELQLIKIGNIGSYSCNFYRSSFVVRSEEND